MKAIHAVTIGAAAVALAGLALLSSRSRGPSAPATSAPPEAARGSAVDPTRAALALLQGEVAALRAALAAAKSGEGEAQERGASEPPVDLQDHAEAEARRQARLVAIETAFRGEATDGAWSASAAATVREASRSAGLPDGVVRSVDCRSRTCRVELAEGDSPEVAKALPLFFMAAGTALPSATVAQVEGAAAEALSLVYLSRE